MNRPKAVEDLLATADYIKQLEDSVKNPVVPQYPPGPWPGKYHKPIEIIKIDPELAPNPPEATVIIAPKPEPQPEVKVIETLEEPPVQAKPAEPVKIKTKRIAFLGNFRETYCSEVHHAASLEALGHQVFRLQETNKTSSQILAMSRQCDAFVWVHTHGWNTMGSPSMKVVLQELRRMNKPTLSYHLDLWMGLKRQEDMKRDPVWEIEHFFTVDKQMADWFNEEKAKGGLTTGHYLPAGVYHAECQLQDVPRTNDVIFTGSRGYHDEWKYRVTLLDWLTGNYKERFKHYGGGGLPGVRGQQLNDLYARTKIVIGDTLCLGFNTPYYYSDRIFEVIGRGGFIIHPYIKGLDEIFGDRKHCVFYEYNNFGQLKELIDYYLEHDEEREQIRKAGHELVKSSHTYVNRWETIMQTLFKQ